MKFTSLYKLSEKDKEEMIRKILPEKPPEDVMTVNKEMWQEFMNYVVSQKDEIYELREKVNGLVYMSEQQHEQLRKLLMNSSSVIGNRQPEQEIDRSMGGLFVDGEKEEREISESWEDIIASVNDGTYREKYKIGNFKPLDLGSEGIIRMQIAGFDAEPLADGSGKAAITWIAMDTLKTAHRMNPVYKEGKVGTGALGGWKESEMRRYLEETVKPLIPVSVRNSIKLVKKYSLSAYENIAGYVYDEETEDYLWIPSAMEIDMPDESGDLEVYHADFDVYYSIWLDSCSWLRSVGKIGSFYTSEGRWESAKFNLAVTLCFCT